MWLGQLVTMIGSKISGFGMAIWLYQKTGSTSLFAMMGLAVSIPTLIAAPFAGALADRWDRRTIMLLGDAGNAVSTLILFIAFTTGSVKIWHLFVYAVWNSLCGVMHATAYESSVTLLAPKKHLGRVTGMASLGPAIVNIGAPFLAGILLEAFGMVRLLLLGVVGAGFAVLMLIVVWADWPSSVPKEEEAQEEGRFIDRLTQGASFLWARPSLIILLSYFTIIHFLLRLTTSLLTPYLLSFTSPAAVGRIVSTGGLAMFIGSLFASATGGFAKRIRGIAFSGSILGLGFVLIGIRPQTLFVTIGMVVFMGIFPIFRAGFYTLWRLKIPASLQGRTHAVSLMVIESAPPLSYLSAAVLVDHVTGPLAKMVNSQFVIPGLSFDGSAGAGIGVLMALSGLAAICLSIAALRISYFRNIESELPDQLVEIQNEVSENKLAAQSA